MNHIEQAQRRNVGWNPAFGGICNAAVLHSRIFNPSTDKSKFKKNFNHS